MNRSGNPQPNETKIIAILLVDDVPEARENVKKLLAFEPDFKVVGTAGTGREGVQLARELRPDIIIMDINMPDMDGIQATSLINESVPTAAVIMMSVQTDKDYLLKAMNAGARHFLGKPVSPDELYGTIRRVYAEYEPMRRRMIEMQNFAAAAPQRPAQQVHTGTDSDSRPGHIIVVYSPQGGVGVTTIAANMASSLMRDGRRVLLVDADLQFGDVGVLLNIPSQSSTMVDLVDNIHDLDTELFDKIVFTHDTGLKVLSAPPRPEFADPIIQTKPTAVSQIIEKIKTNYDYVVVDTPHQLDENTISLFDAATKIIIVGMPTLASVKNVRFVLDLFDQLNYAPDKTHFILNRVPEERIRQRAAIPSEKIQKFLKRPIEVEIPADDLTALQAMSRGVLMVANPRDRGRSPIKEIITLAEQVATRLAGDLEQADEFDISGDKSKQRKSGIGLRFGKA